VTRLLVLLRPANPVERALTYSTMAASLAKGLLFSVSVLYFVRVLGLSAGTVGIGLTVAGGVGVLASLAGGYLADRVGALRVLRVTTVGHGIGLAAYVVAGDAAAFVTIAAVVVGMQAMQRTAQSTVIAQSIDVSTRVQTRARLRSITNVFIGLGAGVAALALLVGTPAAYMVAMAGSAVLVLASSFPLRALSLPLRAPARGSGLSLPLRAPARGSGLSLPLRAPTPARDVDVRPAGSPFRDSTYVTATALNAVMCVQFGLLTVGVPLWVSIHTGAPAATMGVLLALNTAVVALFQTRAARTAPDVPRAGRAVARAGLLLAVACGLYAAAAFGEPAVAVVVLIAATSLHSAGEVLSESGAWTLAFDLADPRLAGAYQGVSQTGPAVAGMLAPALVTATAIAHGPLGWAALAAMFLAAGTATHLLTRRVSRTAAPHEALSTVGVGGP
jgi:Major Facilitator Superfamily